MELLIKLLPIIFRAINAAPQIQQAIRMGTPIDKAVEDNARDLLPLFAEIGKQMFRIKWIQTALNVIGANPPLDVDGEYGPRTTEAVLQFQKAQGLVTDGWAGDTTHAALQLAFSKARSPGT